MISFYSTTEEITHANGDTVILPIGSTEQHGPHLPVSTDSIIAESVAGKVAEELNIFLLPVLSFSTCREHRGTKGSIWINPDTMYRVLCDMVLSLKEQGFKKIILLIAHGGVFIAGPAIRQLNADNPDISVIKVELVQFMQLPEMMQILECGNNLHAGEFETSLMLFLKEELVHMAKAIDHIPNVPRDYLNYDTIFRFCPDGVWGKPSLANREKGKQIFSLLVEKSIAYINDTFDILRK